MNGLSFSDATDIKLGATSITALYYGSTLIWPSGPAPTNWANEYLQIQALEPMTLTTSMYPWNTYTDTDPDTGEEITWDERDPGCVLDVYYSTDLQTWTHWDYNETVQMSTGDIVYFKGNYSYDDSGYDPEDPDSQHTPMVVCPLVNNTEMFNVQGNIMSLVNNDYFQNQTSLLGYDNCFNSLFAGNNLNVIGVVDTSNLIMPATTLAPQCYGWMFYFCNRMTNCMSTLPATTLEPQCYYGMFWQCSLLTTAPSLPATTLATECYREMFNNCGLINAPSLPATILEASCYQQMFYGCSSLTTAPSLPATTLAESCYQHMFQYCTSLTTAPSLPATILAESCYQQMFVGCTSLTTAPLLPATTLTEGCYFSMFYGCSSLNYVKCLATDISATNCTDDWLNGVGATGAFVKNANMNNWTSGPNGIPSGWTVQNA